MTVIWHCIYTRSLKKRKISSEIMTVTGRADICALLHGSLNDINNAVVEFINEYNRTNGSNETNWNDWKRIFYLGGPKQHSTTKSSNQNLETSHETQPIFQSIQNKIVSF